MDKGRDFISYAGTVPTLKVAAMIKIAIKLWEHQCCHKSTVLSNVADDDDDDEAKYTFHLSGSLIMEKQVLDNLSILQLPKLLEQRIMQFIRPIGQHLYGWLNPKNFHSIGLRTLDHICWTSEGTVDVSEMIRYAFDSQWEDPRMFMAISNACVEDLVMDAWCIMPEYVKDIRSIRNNVLCRKYRYGYHLVMYWLCFCSGELPELIQIIKNTDDDDIYNHGHSVHKNMFYLSIQMGNELAAKYFWQKLTREERNINIMEWIDDLFLRMQSNDDIFDRRPTGFSGILFFLLGQMNDCEQQKQVFQKYNGEILETLLFDWPWQKYLSQTISVMFPFLKKRVYVQFMSILASNIERGRMEQELFKEVWCASPSNMKICFKEEILNSLWFNGSVFNNLIKSSDFDNLKLIMSCTSEEEKRSFVFSCAQSYTFISSAINNLDIIDGFLKDMLPSENDIIICKVQIINYLEHPRARYWIREFDRKAIENFLNWCFDSVEEMNQFKEYVGL